MQELSDYLAAGHLEEMAGRYLARRGRMKGVCSWEDLRAELISVGYEGVAEAARRWDPERGVKFRTLADRWAQGRMLEHLRTGGGARTRRVSRYRAIGINADLQETWKGTRVSEMERLKGMQLGTALWRLAERLEAPRGVILWGLLLGACRKSLARLLGMRPAEVGALVLEIHAAVREDPDVKEEWYDGGSFRGCWIQEAAGLGVGAPAQGGDR